MGDYVDIGSVRTWYETSGHGEPLVLLHGGLSNNGAWAEQFPAFAEHFSVFAPERRGHGHSPDVDGPLSYEVMARDTIGFIDAMVGGSAHLVGWSDGGTVGLVVASIRPDLVGQLVSIGANFDASGYVAGFDQMIESWDPNGQELASLRGAYEAASPDGPEHWPVVLSKTKDMWLRDPFISLEELSHIRARTLVIVGDDDVCTLEHTTALYRAIPDAELAVIPGTSHAVPKEKPDLVNMMVLDFLRNEPVETMIPVRRAVKADPA